METSAPRPRAAAVWMLGSIAAFTGMTVAGREVSTVHDSFEIMAVRSAIGLVLVLAYGAAFGRLADIRTDRLGGHVLRNVVHFTGQNLWFYAIAMIPLAQVVALEFTSPVWVVLLAPLVVGEKLTRVRLIAATLGLIGTLIVSRPDPTMISPGVMAAAGCAVCFAMTALLTKRLTKGEPILSILVWLTAMQLVFGVVASFAVGDVAWPTAQTLPWLGLIGVAGVGAHLCLTKALSLAAAGYVMPLDFLRLPLVAAIGALAYGEGLDLWVLAGGAVIFAGILMNVRSDLRPKSNNVSVTTL